MKLFVINGSPRKNCNTAQLLDAFVEGAKSVAPEVEVTYINVYDYQFTGCKSCFACQLTANRAYLECKVEDEIHDLLDEARHSDGIAIGSPIYFLDISAQAKCFLERLNYPGPSEKKIPSTFLYTMNADEDAFHKFRIDDVIRTTRFFMKNNFGVEPNTVYSFNTFQYNDREALNEKFRQNIKVKLEHRDEQFPHDLEAAQNAGRKMVKIIQSIC
jgi:multimeric flavodoxin WrbA